MFCGSSAGARPGYATAAAGLGRRLAERGIRMVYGGGNIGLMGVVADAALQAGGQVLGILPQALMVKELGHRGLSELRIVGSMHERKAEMARESDAFIVLPGGFGTLEEMFENVTWVQLGIHAKPCGILNVEDYFDPLLRFLDHMVEERFISFEHRGMIIVDDEPDALVERLEAYRPPTTSKWLHPTQG